MTVQDDPDQLVSKLNPVVLDFVYVGIATFFASFMEIYLFALAGRVAPQRVLSCIGRRVPSAHSRATGVSLGRGCSAAMGRPDPSLGTAQASGRPTGSGRGILAASCGKR